MLVLAAGGAGIGTRLTTYEPLIWGAVAVVMILLLTFVAKSRLAHFVAFLFGVVTVPAYLQYPKVEKLAMIPEQHPALFAGIGAGVAVILAALIVAKKL